MKNVSKRDIKLSKFLLKIRIFESYSTRDNNKFEFSVTIYL